MLTTWMRRWSWAIAMTVAIVITVGSLIILESGRLRVTRAYETALEAKTAATELAELWSGLTLASAAQQGYLLTREPSQLGLYRTTLGHIDALAARLGNYYGSHRDAAAQARLGHVVRIFAAQRAANEPALADTSAPAARVAPEVRAELAGLQTQRSDIDALLAHEQARAQHALEASRAERRAASLSVAAVSALNIILFVLLFRNLGTQIGRQEQVQRQLLTQRQELDRLVGERTGQLEALAWHLQSVSEDEKTKLARELHDELGAILTASKMDVAWVQSKLKATQPALADKLARALGSLDQGIMLKRRIIEDMRPTVLTNFGLVTALRTLAEETAQRTNWILQLDLPPADVELDEQVAIALFRVAQEALTNAAKYARAARLSIALALTSEGVTLRIADDGVGMGAAAPYPGIDKTAGNKASNTHGLLGMRQRVAARGGSFEVRPARPRGTEICVAMPVAPGGGRQDPALASAAAPAALDVAHHAA